MMKVNNKVIVLKYFQWRFFFFFCIFIIGIFQGTKLFINKEIEKKTRIILENSNDSTIPEPLPVQPLSEQELSLSLLLMISLEILAFFTSYILKKTHFKYLQDAGATMLFGTLIGIITRFVKTDTAQRLRNALSFNSNVFFLFFLPPIIFESGYSMKRKNFFQNLGSICAYAFGGTTIATFMTGILLYGVVKTGWMIQMSFLECLIWGSLISATDPVTVLAIFKELKVDLDLYSNVFGESVLNDAVAIVLYRTVLGFLDSPLSVSSFFLAIGQFTLIFVGSCLIGTFIALLSSLFFKYVEIYRFSYLETAILLLFAYSSYLIADGVQLSGIVSVLFCGIVMAHYTYNNLSELSKELSANLLSVFAMLTETLVFVYLGLALFTSESNIDIVFIIAGIIVISIARAANIYPLTFLVNLSRPRERWITQKYQFFMWFAGLRGAIAFVLSLDVPTPNGPYMHTTTIAIIFFTVLVEGGFTIPLLQKLKIPMNVTKPPDISEDAYGRLNVKVQHSFFKWDKRWLKPFFTTQHVPISEYSDVPNDIESIELNKFEGHENENEVKINEEIKEKINEEKQPLKEIEKQ